MFKWEIGKETTTTISQCSHKMVYVNNQLPTQRAE